MDCFCLIKAGKLIPEKAPRVPGSWGSQISRLLAHESGKFVGQAASTVQELFLVLISIRGWVDPQGDSSARKMKSMKNPN